MYFPETGSLMKWLECEIETYAVNSAKYLTALL